MMSWAKEMKNAFAVAMLAMAPLCLMAQEETADFTSDLFGGLTGVDVLPKGRLQWETYALYEHTTMSGEKSETWCPNTSVLRYGINSTTEISMQAAFLHATDGGTDYTGFSDLAVGFKTRMFEGWKAVPAIALRGTLFIPGGENYAYLPDKFGCQLDLLFYNQLTTWCDLSYMGSIIWDDASHPTILWGASLGLSLTERLSFSVEERNCYYGPDKEERLQPWVGLTLSYQVHPRAELGVSSDISLRHSRDYFNIMLGVAWQLTEK